MDISTVEYAAYRAAEAWADTAPDPTPPPHRQHDRDRFLVRVHCGGADIVNVTPDGYEVHRARIPLKAWMQVAAIAANQATKMLRTSRAVRWGLETWLSEPAGRDLCVLAWGLDGAPNVRETTHDWLVSKYRTKSLLYDVGANTSLPHWSEAVRVALSH